MYTRGRMCRYKNIIFNLRKASHRITVNTTSVYLWGSKSLFIFLCSSCAVLTCGVCERRKEKKKKKKKRGTCQKSKYLHINLTSALRNKWLYTRMFSKQKHPKHWTWLALKPYIFFFKCSLAPWKYRNFNQNNRSLCPTTKSSQDHSTAYTTFW